MAKLAAKKPPVSAGEPQCAELQERLMSTKPVPSPAACSCGTISDRTLQKEGFGAAVCLCGTRPKERERGSASAVAAATIAAAAVVTVTQPGCWQERLGKAAAAGLDRADCLERTPVSRSEVSQSVSLSLAAITLLVWYCNRKLSIFLRATAAFNFRS